MALNVFHAGDRSSFDRVKSFFSRDKATTSSGMAATTTSTISLKRNHYCTLG